MNAGTLPVSDGQLILYVGEAGGKVHGFFGNSVFFEYCPTALNEETYPEVTEFNHRHPEN
jgi:hypothetical protein